MGIPFSFLMGIFAYHSIFWRKLMQICTIASSSSGNAMVISSGDTHILLDAGISARRITTTLQELGIAPSDLSGILITHEHRDHMVGLTTLTKKLRVPIYTTAAVARQLEYRVPLIEELIHPIVPEEGFSLGGLWVKAFATPHDVNDSVGYRIQGDGGTVALATDLGHLTPAVLHGILGADLVVAETNHDEDWVKSGPYPFSLKSRILGDFGHLSNETGAELVRRAVEAGAKGVLLAHLSSENNTPARALHTTQLHLSAADIDPVADIHLSVAPKNEPSPILRLDGSGELKVIHRQGAALC